MAMTGTVKFFNGERGYGFIKPDDGGRDVFVHITAVERAGLKDLTEGQRIRGRTGQEGQRPQGGQSGDFIVRPRVAPTDARWVADMCRTGAAEFLRRA
jgi:CspA family cold shock protein